jgi:hypothetical protein
MSQSIARRTVPVLVSAILVALFLPSMALAKDECTLQANQGAASGPAPDPEISLEASPATEVINFGGSRDTKSFHAVFKASDPLPSSLTAEQLEITVPRPPHRVGKNLESESLDFPTFGEPKFINGRKEIQLLTCISAAGADAGTYTGQISINGPSGLNGATITTTINAKSVLFFWLGSILGLLASAVLLTYRVRQELKDKSVVRQLLSVAVPLVAAFIAMWTIYANDPAWGADRLSAVFALAGAAFGAAGGGSLITAFQGGAKK